MAASFIPRRKFNGAPYDVATDAETVTIDDEEVLLHTQIVFALPAPEEP